jgi:hypothetical protein
MIQSEMSRIFEGYVALNGFQQVGADDEDGPRSGSTDLQSPGSGGGVYGGDGTVFPHFREMF